MTELQQRNIRNIPVTSLREKRGCFFPRSVHVPSYDRKQTSRLCPPISLRLSFKLSSLIHFFSFFLNFSFLFSFFPVSLLLEILPVLFRRGFMSPHAQQRTAKHTPSASPSRAAAERPGRHRLHPRICHHGEQAPAHKPSYVAH